MQTPAVRGHRKRSSRAAGAALAALIAVAVVACTPTSNPLDTGEPKGDRRVIVVGSQGSAENEIIAQLYGQVLAQAGYDVQYATSIGSRTDHLAALSSGAINLVPENAASLLHELDAGNLSMSLGDIYGALTPLLAPDAITLLDAAPADSADVFVVSRAFADGNALVSLGDLEPMASSVIIGGAPGVQARWQTALKASYGISGQEFFEIDDDGGASTVQGLIGGRIQVAVMSATNPAIAANDFVILDDPENISADENVVPLIDNASYSDKVAGLINAVSASLTTSELARLHAIYFAADHPSSSEIAAVWLAENGLLP